MRNAAARVHTSRRACTCAAARSRPSHSRTPGADPGDPGGTNSPRRAPRAAPDPRLDAQHARRTRRARVDHDPAAPVTGTADRDPCARGLGKRHRSGRDSDKYRDQAEHRGVPGRPTVESYALRRRLSPPPGRVKRPSPTNRAAAASSSAPRRSSRSEQVLRMLQETAWALARPLASGASWAARVTAALDASGTEDRGLAGERGPGARRRCA